MKRSRWIAVIVLVPVLGLVGMSVASCSVPELGIVDGRLRPCPSSPNCVSSLATDAEHRVDPLPLPAAKPGVAWAELERIALGLPRATLLKSEPNYLRVQYASLIMRFKDDLEFHRVPAEQVIHVRAAARVGYSDMGVNRARVEEIRRQYTAWLAARRK